MKLNKDKMEGKKISFSFTKTKKVEKPIVEEEKQFIECLEEKSIKVVGGEAVTEKAPLIIPVKPNTLQTAERMKQIAEEVESALSQPDAEEKPESPKAEPIPENETLEQRATRELLEDSKKKIEVETPQYAISVPADKLPLDGQKESTLDDYEEVPVQEFGLAMLRGMGWQPGKDQSRYKEPQLRPKGLGLGADKVIKDSQKKNTSKNTDDSLSIVKNAFVKITTGKFSGYYGKIVSLDEENGRVLVELPMKKEIVSLSEFMMLPVTKAEFDKESRVINSEQYEAFKKNEGKSSERIDSSKDDREASSSKRRNENKERRNYETERRERDKESFSNGKNMDAIDKKDSSNNDDKFRGKREEKRKYSSTDSLNSLSDNDQPRKRKDVVGHHGSSDSDSSDEYTKHKKSKKNKHSSDKKRDIDKKRKGKKKKRDRDRSPNYRKHRSKN